MSTGYELDDLRVQVQALTSWRKVTPIGNKIWLALCRIIGQAAEDQAAREYLKRAKINGFDPWLKSGRAASL